MPNRFEKYGQQPNNIVRPVDPRQPYQLQQEQGQAQAAPFAAPKAKADLTGKVTDNRINEATAADQIRKTKADADTAERAAAAQRFSHALQLRSAYDGLPTVKEYRVTAAQIASGLKTAGNATGDNALIYAYAKTMDPASVVRESEMGMAASGQSVFDSVAANMKKQFGIEGGGQLDQKIRDRLRREMINKGTEANRGYNAQRQRFTEDAGSFGLDPKQIIGDHDGDAFRPAMKEYNDELKARGPKMSAAIDKMVREGVPFERANERIVAEGWEPVDPKIYNESLGHAKRNPGYKGSYGKATTPDSGAFNDSFLGQFPSGFNEGLATVMGAPIDLSAMAVNLIPKGINALANTDIPTIDDPAFGGEWFKRRLDDVGGRLPTSPTTGGQVGRRIGESVGASAVPASMAGNLARGGGQILAGVTGGAGAATAQQMFPGNKWAEMAGELAGGGATVGGLASNAKRQATRQMEAAVPTVDQLKDQAGQLYRQAEARGVVADPAATQQLADNFRAALTAEGKISPTGRISDVYPKAREAQQLMDDYAGNPMSPTQMQSVRKVASDGLTSPDNTERRLGGILTDVFDDWANPRAPELSQARDVASRYLTTEQLTKARELAGAQASQFTGSGFENALRTQYRGLDRGAIKGTKRFSDDVTGAIERVSRGTPFSNAMRGLGRLAPTGPVSIMANMGAGAGMGALTSGPIGAAVGGTMAGAGMAGRGMATHLGIKAADNAELVARNGGNLPDVPMLNPETMQSIGAWLAAESAKYSGEGEDAAKNKNGKGDPNPLARRKSQRVFPNLPTRR